VITPGPLRAKLWVMVRMFLSALAIAVLTSPVANAAPTKTTKAVSIAGPEPKAVAAAVTTSATPVAVRLGAKLGRPSCPPVEKPRVGLTLQCTVAFDTSPVAWLVTLRTGGILDAAPTFPVVSRRQAELAAGGGSACRLAAFVGVPVGATVNCTVAKAAVDLTVGADGSLRRSDAQIARASNHPHG
jgi:hypothetical protein